jgi:hypothetical protein
MVAKPSEMNYGNAEMERAKELEQIIPGAEGHYGPIHVQIATLVDRNSMVSNLYRIACLIYVKRVVHCVSGTEFRHRRLVREGILLLTEMKTFQNAWPLFNFPCEATAKQLATISALLFWTSLNKVGTIEDEDQASFILFSIWLRL